jgi:integrase/recombinase XerD
VGEALRVERVVARSGREGWTLVGGDGHPVGPVDRFLRYRFHTEASPNTLRGYAHDLKHFFAFVAEQGLDWRHLTPADLGSFTAWLRRPAPNVLPLPGAPPARSEATVSRALSAVFAFYDFHRLEGVALADRLTTFVSQHRGTYKPFLHGIAAAKQRGRPGRLTAPRRQPRALDPVQLAQIIAAQTRLRDRLLFALLGLAGLRIGQALGLRHEDLRPWARELELVPRPDNANRARGKGSRGTVPVLPELVSLYLLYMEHEYGLLDSDYVFVNLWGGEVGAPMRYSAVDKLVRRTERRVGFRFTPHDLRHTFVTTLRRQGVALEVVSKLVTHRSITTTADTYSHLDAVDLRAELERAGWSWPIGNAA